MRSLLTGMPDHLRGLVRRIDTVGHHGVPGGCVLELDLQSCPPETVSFDPVRFVTGGGRPLGLREAVEAIHRAADDHRVSGLIARVQFSSAAPAVVAELREAVAAFAAVKPSLAWAETYPGTLSYYLASAFGEVWLQPSGTVGLIGFATNALFLRDALGKAGIDAQFVARGEYKSAANLFTEAHYTEAHREADSALIASLHSQVWQGIAASRGIEAAELDRLADRAPLLREEACAAKLVDRIGFRDEAYLRIAELTGTAETEPEQSRLALSRYARAGRGLPSLPGRSRPAIAIVTVAGPIVSGHGGPQALPMARTSAGGDTVAAALRAAAEDEDVKAVVLRIDSPGGAVTASETIWRAVGQVRSAGKPVVASMGAVAASGGYYAAMAAEVIVASPVTITGSIGVVTGKFVARELTDRLGVGSDSVRTNANADAWSPGTPFTAEQLALVEAEADLFYQDFVGRVAAARGMTVEQVDEVARGRIWTGADARDRGLVDELGGLRAAVRKATELAGLAPDADVTLVDFPGSSVWDLLRSRSSTEPAATLAGLAAGLFGSAMTTMIGAGSRSLSGSTALWLGDSRF